MALYYSSLFFNPALISAIQPSNTPLLLTPVRILRFRHSKPFSQFTLAKHPRASPPHKYTYPDPIPEFAVAVRTYMSRVYIYVGFIVSYVLRTVAGDTEVQVWASEEAFEGQGYIRG